jgi:hypothetical protein
MYRTSFEVVNTKATIKIYPVYLNVRQLPSPPLSKFIIFVGFEGR